MVYAQGVIGLIIIIIAISRGWWLELGIGVATGCITAVITYLAIEY